MMWLIFTGELHLQNLQKGVSNNDPNYIQELIKSNHGAKQHGSRSEQLEPNRRWLDESERDKDQDKFLYNQAGMPTVLGYL